MKREKEAATHVKNETDVEGEVVVTFESHPRTQEDIETEEAVKKLTKLKQKKRKLEMEEENLQEEKQALDAEIEEQRAKVHAIAAK